MRRPSLSSPGCFRAVRRPLAVGIVTLFTAVAVCPAARGQTPPGEGMPAATPLDSRYQPAKVLRHPDPAYPLLALLNRVEGVVGVRMSIDDQGKVTAVSLTRSGGSVMLDSVVGDPRLTEWTFQPATLDGKPIAASMERELQFKLDPEEQRKLAQERVALPEGLPDPPYPPEAIPLKLEGMHTCTIGVTWSSLGLVDQIYLNKSSGSDLLNRVALSWAYTHWRVNPKNIVYPKGKDGKDKLFTKEVTFTPPAAAAH